MTMTPGTRRGHPTKTEYTSIMASVQLQGMTRPMIVIRKLSVVSDKNFSIKHGCMNSVGVAEKKASRN